jgi:hypothetical protein
MSVSHPAIDADADRADLIEALLHHCHTAKREMPVVGNEDHPTPWDIRHQQLNEQLTELEAMDRA